MARVDKNLIRLTVAFNKIVENGLDAKLPDDLQGDAIPNQVLQHQAALTGRTGANASESGAQGGAAATFVKTRRLLTRARHAVLASFDDPDDPRIEELGKLGVGENQADDRLRLDNLAKTLAPHVAAGTIALVPDLQPAALQAHADLHLSMTKDKGEATTTRQTMSRTLHDERDDTREMLQRIKAFLKAHKQPLVNYGFDLPVPPSRPRLTRGEQDPVAGT